MLTQKQEISCIKLYKRAPWPQSCRVKLWGPGSGCHWTKEWDQLPGSQMGLWQDSGQRWWTATKVRGYGAKPQENPWSRNGGKCLRLKGDGCRITLPKPLLGASTASLSSASFETCLKPRRFWKWVSYQDFLTSVYAARKMWFLNQSPLTALGDCGPISISHSGTHRRQILWDVPR